MICCLMLLYMYVCPTAVGGTYGKKQKNMRAVAEFTYIYGLATTTKTQRRWLQYIYTVI